MRKRSSLLAFLFLIFALNYPVKYLYGGMSTLFFRGTSAGCSKGTTVFSENFESFADGAELDTDAGAYSWTEESSSVNVFVADDNDTVAPHGGSMQGWVDYAGGFTVTHGDLTQVTSGYITVDFWWYNVSGQVHSIRPLCTTSCASTSNRIVELTIDGSNNLKINENGTPATVLSSLSAGYHHFEVQVNLDDVDGTGCINLWVDGTEYNNSGSYWSTRSGSAPGNADAFGPVDYDSDYWFDDILIYQGQRCDQ